VNTDSFERGLLDSPIYTRPQEFRGKEVPEVLLSGNHAKIKGWREEKAIKLTRKYRKDIVEN